MHIVSNLVVIYWRPWWAYEPFKRPALRKRLHTPGLIEQINGYSRL